ncbi:MAG TPA: hypothetical protein VMR98_05465, partial [Candidatus Polarisedimenticolaceae bacterium]|nr:hypothetical protein [Candidatus Polarisedimenticolaceae bacterium]
MIIIGALVAGIIAVLVWWLIGYFTTGTIVITTNDQNSVISLQGVDNPKFRKEAHSRLSIKVNTGRYVAEVAGGAGGVRQEISIKSREKLEVALNPAQPSAVEPVSYTDAYGVAASPTDLTYLDHYTQYLFHVSADNSPRPIDPSHQFRTVKWAGPEYGVAQDEADNLFVIDHYKVSALTLPAAKEGTVNYAVAPDRQIYLAYGSKVYSGNRAGNFKMIYQANAGSPTVTASTKGVLIADKIEGKTGKAAARLVVVQRDGAVHKKDI